MENKREKLTAIDSFICFMFSLVMPILFSLTLEVIVIILSKVAGVDYEVFANQWLVKGVTYILSSLSFLCSFIYYYKRNNISFDKTIEYKKNYNVYSILITIGIAVVLVFGFTNFIGLVDYLYALTGYAPSGDLPIINNTLGNAIISIMLWAVVPAICEELLFRGVIFKGLLDKYKPLYAILIGGALFMLMHGSLQQTLYQFILGVVLCLVYYLTKNIFYPMLLHFLNNAVVIFCDYLSLRFGFNFASSFTTAWSFIWPILVVILAVAIVLGLIYLLQKINKNKYESVVSTEYEVMEKPANARLNKWILASNLVAIILWISGTISGWIQ